MFAYSVSVSCSNCYPLFKSQVQRNNNNLVIMRRISAVLCDFLLVDVIAVLFRLKVLFVIDENVCNEGTICRTYYV